MQKIADEIVVSATDFNNFLACEHLTTLELQVLNGERERPDTRPTQATLLARLGEEHEQNYLQTLMDQGLRVTTIERGNGNDGIRRSALETEAAMARGDEVIYQATFFDGTSLGYADFLRKVHKTLPSGRWAWYYEVEDTKLARQTQPYFLLQLAYYSEHVQRIQGVPPPNMHVILGSGVRETFRVEDFAAYYRSVRKQFQHRLIERDVRSYPIPVPHCGLCVWNEDCEARRIEDDHLSLVAGITRRQIDRLDDAGIKKLEVLARTPSEPVPEDMEQSTFDKLRRQARLQHAQRKALADGESDPWRYEFLETGIASKVPPEDGKPEALRGFYLLPKPSPGDVFFDMEGDPYFEIGKGLEYLFGAYTPERTFHAFWGCDRTESPCNDRAAEKKAFQEFIDFVMDRRSQFPDMHIYHYASYEKTALKKLALRHVTRELEVDAILREERLVDLYTVVRQALVVGQPSYSIKMIEEYYGKRGSASNVKAGDESILRFEEWLATRDGADRDDGILKNLEIYNRYDCVSTLDLREWLLGLRDRAAGEFEVEIPPYPGKTAEQQKGEEKLLELKAALDERIPDDFDPAAQDFRSASIRPLFIARHMLEYHWREHKPIYWQFYDRCDTYAANPDSLLDDSECIVGLVAVGEPTPVKRSKDYEFRFPPQLHKIEDGTCYDPATRERLGTIAEIEDGDDFGRLVIRRQEPLPHLPDAIVVRKIVQPSTILDALARFATALLSDGSGCRYRAAFDVLTSAPPRLNGIPRGASLQPALVDEQALLSAVLALDDSYLFVQGPPGAGKTYLGARTIVALLARGKKVGVTANSHKAIHNLLDEVEKVAAERRVDFVGIKKSSKNDEDSLYKNGRRIGNSDTVPAGDFDLLAGTAWAFGPEVVDQRLDYLFIDEAGQVALPHAVAVMTAARNAVLLGDPLQLAQVSKTQHPGNLGVSVLDHLLGCELRPVTPDRGILLTDSYRMHPNVCRFISELMYEGKLRSAPGRELQDVDSPGLHGSGLRYLAVEHTGNSQRSEEEANRIAAEIDALSHGSVRDIHGVTRPLEARDIIVVTPYNAQVRCIRRVLNGAGHPGVEVGTVDKFQGREAYVVFFSTAASTPEEAPRGVDFIFDRQRFNVAISRARAMAVMVGSPLLLVQNCNSIEQVRAANGVCRFIEEKQ